MKQIDFTRLRTEPSELATAASLAEAAALLLRDIEAAKKPECRLDSAAWRLTDALTRVREFAEAEGITGLGIDQLTGLQVARGIVEVTHR